MKINLEELKKEFDEEFGWTDEEKQSYVDEIWSWVKQKLSLTYQKGWDDRWEHEKAELIKVIDSKLNP